jgi:hypothetical protein
VARAEKKLKDLQEEKRSLEKKLAENEKDQEDTIRDIELQKKTLENFRGKRSVKQ